MDTPKITVRQARREDAALIAEAVAMAVGYDTSHPLYSVFLALAERENTQYSYRNALVGEVDGVAAGAIVGYDGARLEELRQPIYPLLEQHLGTIPHIEDETSAGEFYLDSAGVLPQFQGLGVGRALLTAMSDRAFAEGHERVGLIVDFDNPQAEKLYTSLGFERVGTQLFLGHQMWHLQKTEKQKPKMTEKEKMLHRMLYDANNDAALIEERKVAKELCYEFNQLRPSDSEAQQRIMRRLLGKTEGDSFCIVAPFWCDYGYNIEIGKNFFANHNTVILDGAKVRFGDNVFVAPNCGFYTAGHPIDAERRNRGLEYAYPITVGDNVWIGAGVQVMPGVTIGSNVVIGGGSVVVKDIPSNVVAVGNPCRVLRPITNEDRLKSWDRK